MLRVDGWWVTGLVDGEGYFSAHFYRDPRSPNSRAQPNITFGVSLRADDIYTIRVLADYFGCGCVAVDTGHNRNPILRFKVFDKGGLIKVCDHFEKFPLQSKKAKEFTLWKQIVKEYASGRGSYDRKKMKEWMDDLVAVKCYRKIDIAPIFSDVMWLSGKKTWRFKKEE